MPSRPLQQLAGGALMAVFFVATLRGALPGGGGSGGGGSESAAVAAAQGAQSGQWSSDESVNGGRRLSVRIYANSTLRLPPHSVLSRPLGLSASAPVRPE